MNRLCARLVRVRASKTWLVLTAVVSAAFAQTDHLSVLLNRYAADPKNAALCEQIGVAYTQLSDFVNAATYFQKAVELNPNRIAARKNLATVLWFAGRKHESSAMFESLEKRIPGDPVPQLYLGLSAYEAKEMAIAAAHFERAGTLASENPEVLPAVTDSYLSTARYEQATSILEGRIRLGNSSAQIYRWLGDAYDGETLPEKAYAAYSKAIEMEPHVAENYMALASFSIEHANCSFAREVLNRGLREVSGSAALRLEIGLAWALQGDFADAKKAFIEANAVDPKWTMPLLALGVTELQTGDAEQAEAYFRKAKLLDPRDARCYYLHALALSRTPRNQESSRSEATAELRRAIALDPLNVKARVLLAQMELSVEHTKEAESELRETIRIDPTDATALYRLALLCRKEGKTAEAERLLAEFRKSKVKAHDEDNQYVLILKTVNK